MRSWSTARRRFFREGVLATFAILLASLTSLSAWADTRDQAKRIYDRIAGVPPYDIDFKLVVLERNVSYDEKLPLKGTGVLARLATMPADPDTIFKGELTTAKRCAWTEVMPLADVKAFSKSKGATINDVLLAGVAGAGHGPGRGDQQEAITVPEKPGE